MDRIRAFLIQIFTGIDNSTFDIARLIWAASCVVFLVLAGWHIIVNKQPFSAVDFGGGAAGVLAGSGLGVAVKSNTEPKP